MATGADLAWLRGEAHLPLEAAAKCLSVSGLKLHLLETQGRNITDEMMAAVREVYRRNQRRAPAEPVEEYIAGLPEQETCTHHWIIERPAGPTSEGECRDCGASRQFRNSGVYHELTD